ncbi:WXG100 family type VII secretion target [Mycobacterium sp. 94-17]|uniref:WXG100 family type VII secretion target n=1 Tax=Mycobacterium sp. 94-17 TaxID=2986147 RepID=UPI002D1E4DA8|nr:WXG100 family type VII secretion target [Mycobacterium sp. 94-17]MEB4209353.1 WXG100 family type VII secretion target [Mycobacterium sp. 94-17]
MTIKVTPEVLRDAANAIKQNMEHAIAIGQGYVSNHENVMNPATWSGAAVTASYSTATEVQNDLNKVLHGGSRLAEGLTQAAALMEHHEADSSHAFTALFGGAGTNV